MSFRDEWITAIQEIADCLQEKEDASESGEEEEQQKLVMYCLWVTFFQVSSFLKKKLIYCIFLFRL